MKLILKTVSRADIENNKAVTMRMTMQLDLKTVLKMRRRKYMLKKGKMKIVVNMSK